MDDSLEAAKDKARAAAGSGFVEQLAERVGGRAAVTAVFAEPVVADGITVIPVAKVRWGFGGGGGRGRGDEGEGEGSGGGGGVAASPLGYIAIEDGMATFRPIRDPAALLPVILAGAFGAWLVLRALARLLR
jgi:uncharacterized spore protein YtfJ